MQKKKSTVVRISNLESFWLHRAWWSPSCSHSFVKILCLQSKWPLCAASSVGAFFEPAPAPFKTRPLHPIMRQKPGPRLRRLWRLLGEQGFPALQKHLASASLDPSPKLHSLSDHADVAKIEKTLVRMGLLCHPSGRKRSEACTCDRSECRPRSEFLHGVSLITWVLSEFPWGRSDEG